MIINFIKKHIRLYLAVIQALNVINFMRTKECSKNDKRCEYSYMNVNYKYTLLGKDTPVCCLTHLYEILKSITNLFNEHGINYFIMYGTLLGQVRHNQTFIPWDTDVDVVVMNEDKKKVIDLLIKELSIHYFLQANRNNIARVYLSKTNRLHADVYFWKEEEGILIDILNDYWIKKRIKKQDVFPLKKARLYDFDVKIPCNSIKVLKDTYSEDCLDIAYKKYAFKKEVITTFNKGKLDLKYNES